MKSWPWHSTSLALGLGKAVPKPDGPDGGSCSPWEPFQPTHMPKREADGDSDAGRRHPGVVGLRGLPTSTSPSTSL